MEMKTKILDKKHLLIIVISIFAIIISYFNVTYAYFEDSKNQPISIKSVNTFGESTVYNTDIELNGTLTYTTDKTNMLKNNNTLSFTKDNVETHDYLLTVATQVEPHTTEYEENEYTSISYEIYHKTDINLDTSSFTCVEGKYNDGDTCNTGTFIENSLNGLPFELIKDYRITDTNTHYFDIYIYLNNEIESKMFKTKIFYLDKAVEKEITGKTLQEVKTFIANNEPDLNTGLIPVVYDDKKGNDTHWFVADTTKAWYDYESQWWANAVSIDSTTEGIREKYVNSDGTYNKGVEISSSDWLAMFVWIPRYSYTIGCTSESSCLGYKIEGASNLATATPGAIDIKFVDKDTSETYTGDSPTYTYTSETDRNPTNYYTHPAFNFENDKLSGLWVGKFETSTAPTADCYNSTTDNCAVGATEIRILPNITSMRYQKIANQFAYSQYFSSKDNIYGLMGDSHMMKNSEWGAVAYISQSVYGKYGNPNYEKANKEIYKNDSSGYYTGMSSGLPSQNGYSVNGTCKYDIIEDRGEGIGSCGAGASTTGNIYGIYDMSGGAYEYVMGYYTKATIIYPWGSAKSGNKAGFTNNTKPAEKYFNGYTSVELFNISSEVVSHATAETPKWYDDSNTNISDSSPWVVRGGVCANGNAAGIFNSYNNLGGEYKSNSFRIALVLN